MIILIGSRALNFYGLKTNSTDIDLLVDNTSKNSLCGICEKKEGLMLWFGSKKKYIKVDLFLTEQSESNQIIHDICAQDYSKTTMLLPELGIEVIVPPMEILYAIKKSHIHRLLQFTDNQDQNIKIWQKHIGMYTLMREKLGYIKMDECIYGKDRYGPPLPERRLSDEDQLSYATRLIFLKRFQETNDRVSDTHVNMDQDAESFFNDNVERFIEHDALHRLIAEAYRGTSELLFERFQKSDSESVEMDRELFSKATPEDRLQCLREEIVSLLLERAWIPDVMNHYKKENIPYVSYDTEQIRYSLKEIICNFVTNLCGSGHHWLRRFALDHCRQLSNLDGYDLDALYQIVVQITGVSTDRVYGHKSMHKFIDISKNNGVPYNLMEKLFSLPPPIYSNVNLCDWYTNPVRIKTANGYHITFEQNKDTDFILDFFGISSKSDDKSSKSDDKLYYYSHETDDYHNHILYSFDEDVGILYRDNKIQMLITIRINLVYNSQINCEYATLDYKDLSLETIYKTYTRKSTVYYYYSLDDSCGWRDRKTHGPSGRYLTRVGSYDKNFGSFFTHLARTILNVSIDRQPHSGNFSYDGTEQVHNDTDDENSNVYNSRELQEKDNYY